MIKYIGDISINDALILQMFAKKSNNILEFGVGASTQILSYYTQNKIDSVETSDEWINRTTYNFDLMEIKNKPNFILYPSFYTQLKQQYDFIFDDGADEFRLDFAIKTFGLLKIGGFFALHDTRRTNDIVVLSEILKKFSPEIATIFVNYNNSNISIIEKRKALFYENWNEVENKPNYESGYSEIPINLINNYKINNL